MRIIIKCLAAALTALILTGPGAGRGEAERGKQVTGYFADHTYLRPRMEKTTEYVDSFPAYTVVTLETVDDRWAVYTTPGGKTGYVDYTRILPEPEYEKDEENYVYSDKRVEIRGLPKYEAATVYTSKPSELLIADGRSGGFLHVRTADGSGGYILPAWVKKAEFTPEPISPVTLCTAEENELSGMPLQGAPVKGRMEPDRLYRAEAAFGSYYALNIGGETLYVEKNKTAVLSWRGGESRTFFRLPRGGGRKREDAVRSFYANAVIREGGAEMHLPGGETRQLKGGTLVYLYTGYGGWAGASAGKETGYLRTGDAEILTGEAMMAQLKKTDLSGGSIQRSELLDQAFTLIEDGNPFQARYNLLTGAEIRSLFPMGVPYFWGGRNYDTLTERLPAYTTREAWQSSPVYYQKGTIYLYGLDCVGFVKCVYSLAGQPLEGTLVGRRDAAYCEAGEHVYCNNQHPLPEDWTEAARTMRTGDIMVIHHPGTHALMYMGTLREFGYTAEQLPALAEYLDYPLMLQAGENPYSYFRFQSMISAAEERRIAAASPPDGGVGVCILGVPREAAQLILEAHGETVRGFDVEGSLVTMMGFGNVKDYVVYRRNDREPPAGEQTEEDGAEGDENFANPEDTPSPEAAEIPGGTETPGTAEQPEATGAPESTETPGTTEHPEATGTPESTETPGTAEQPETTGTPESAETPGTAEHPETTGTLDSAEIPEATNTPDASEIR